MTWLWSITCWLIRYVYEGFIAGKESPSARKIRFARVPLDFCYIGFVFWGFSSPDSAFYQFVLRTGLSERQIFAGGFLTIFLIWGLMIAHMFPMSKKYLRGPQVNTRLQVVKKAAFLGIYHALGFTILLVSIYSL